MTFQLIFWLFIGFGNLQKQISKQSPTWLGYWCTFAVVIILLIDKCFGG